MEAGVAGFRCRAGVCPLPCLIPNQSIGKLALGLALVALRYFLLQIQAAPPRKFLHRPEAVGSNCLVLDSLLLAVAGSGDWQWPACSEEQRSSQKPHEVP